MPLAAKKKETKLSTVHGLWSFVVLLELGCYVAGQVK